MANELAVKIKADTAALASGLNAAKAKVTAFGNHVKTIGAGMKTAFKGAALGLGVGLAGAGIALKGLFAGMEFGSEVQDLMDKFDLTAEAVQKLTLAAKLGATDIDTLQKSMLKLGLIVNDPSKFEDLSKSLKGLGINDVEGFQSKDQVSQLFAVADAYSRLENKTAANVHIQKLFGKSYGEILVFLKQGKGIMAELANTDFVDAKKIGLLEQLGDAWDKLKYQAQQALAVISGGFVEGNTGMISSISGIGDKLIEYAYKFVEIIKSGQAWDMVYNVFDLVISKLANQIYAAFAGVFAGFGVLWDKFTAIGDLFAQKITTAILIALDSIPGVNNNDLIRGSREAENQARTNINNLNDDPSKSFGAAYNTARQQALASDPYKAGEAQAKLDAQLAATEKAYQEQKKARETADKQIKVMESMNKFLEDMAKGDPFALDNITATFS